MYKDIVVPIIGNQGDKFAINVALDIALAHQARLTVLELLSLPTPPAIPFGLLPDQGMTLVYDELRRQSHRNVKAWQDALADENVPHEVRLVEALFTEPAQLAARHAHHADLAVVAGVIGDSSAGDVAHDFVAAMLMLSGRPLLVVPQRCKAEVPPRRIVVAWQPTAGCARAVHDALPLLRAAEQVDVLVVDPVTAEGGEAAAPGAEITAHLVRHGVHADLQVRKSNDNRVATVLLDHAREMQANMLVVGGYGHSRLREWALGGVTRELLFTATLPVFYSH
ncbi:MAG: universal stress protein [Pseudoxanthomonas sp.]